MLLLLVVHPIAARAATNGTDGRCAGPAVRPGSCFEADLQGPKLVVGSVQLTDLDGLVLCTFLGVV